MPNLKGPGGGENQFALEVSVFVVVAGDGAAPTRPTANSLERVRHFTVFTLERAEEKTKSAKFEEFLRVDLCRNQIQLRLLAAGGGRKRRSHFQRTGGGCCCTNVGLAGSTDLVS